MTNYTFFIVAAYGVTVATIGIIALRIVLDYRRLSRELARYGAAGQRDEGGAA